MDEEEKIKKYIGINNPYLRLLLVPIMCFLIGIVLAFMMKRGTEPVTFFIIIWSGIGCLIFVTSMQNLTVAMKHWRMLIQNNLLDDIKSDFESAIPFIQDKIRTGKKYLFIKSVFGRIISYKEIYKLYVNVERTKTTHRYVLMIQLKDESKVRLCTLTHFRLQDIDKITITELIEGILNNNESIIIDGKWTPYQWIEDIKPNKLQTRRIEK